MSNKGSDEGSASLSSFNPLATRRIRRGGPDRMVREATDTTESAEQQEVHTYSMNGNTLSRTMITDLERKQALLDAMRKKNPGGGTMMVVVDMGTTPHTLRKAASAPTSPARDMDPETFLHLGYLGRRRYRRFQYERQTYQDQLRNPAPATSAPTHKRSASWGFSGRKANAGAGAGGVEGPGNTTMRKENSGISQKSASSSGSRPPRPGR